MKMSHNRISIVSATVLLVASAVFAAGTNKQGIKANVPGTKLGAIGATNSSTTATNPQDTETIQARFARLFPGGGLLDIEGSLRRVYGTTFSTGASPSDSADKFMRQWSMLWKVPYSQLEKVGPFDDGAHTLPLVADDDGENTKFTAAYFRQQASGIPVFRAYGWGLVRNEDNFPMVLAGATLRNIGDIETRISGQDLDSSSIDMGLAANQVLGQFSEAPDISSPRYVIWAGLDEDVRASQLAVEFKITSGEGTENYQKVLFVTDAATGDVLYRESMIYHGSVNVQVNEYVTSDFKADTCGAETTRGMPYAKVTIGTTVLYTNATGALTHTYTGTGPVTVAPAMGGKYFTVSVGSGTLNTVASQSVADGATATFLFNPGAVNGAITTAQTNVYEMANKTRDMILAASPSYPTIATQTGFVVRPNLSGTCNAYYDGNINFYLFGGGCANTGFGDVVGHEYGHHAVSKAGSGQNEYGEGQSDVVGVMITDAAVLGYGFQTCTTGLRTALNNCTYSSTGCSSCGSAIHSCGQLLSGCVWDLRNSLKATYPSDYRTRLAKLCINSMPLHAGSSTIQNDIPLDYLTLNDNDANLGNGTPDYYAIASAFNAHGLTVPVLNLLDISLPNGAPTSVSPDGSTVVNVNISPLSGTMVAGSGKLFYKDISASTYSSVPLASTGTNTFTATFPTVVCNSNIQYYFQATATGGTLVTNPQSGTSAPFTAKAALSSAVLISDTFDVGVSTFTAGAPGDNATTGTWIQSLGYGATCYGSTTGYSGTKAWITAANGCVDVDAGKVSLLSPIVNAAGGDTVEISFAYYLSYGTASPTDDPLEVFVSNDGGASWVLMASYKVATNSATTTSTWSTLKTLNVANYVSATSQMRFKWVASDNGTDNVMEAGVDSVTVSSVTCLAPIPGDLNGDRTVNSADLGIQLGNFGPCTTTPCLGDFNGDNEVNSADVGAMLGYYN